MTIGTKIGTRFGSKIGTQFPNESAAASFSGIVDDLIAAGDTPLAAYSLSHRLYGGYSGALFTMEKVTGGTTGDIGYGSDNLCDQAAMNTLCSGSNGRVVTIKDQVGGALDLTQGTDTRRPKCYDSATGPTLLGTRVGAQFTAASLHKLSRADAFGVTGGPGLTLAYYGACDSSAARRGALFLGDTATGNANIYCGIESATADPLTGSNGATRRNFTEITATTSANGYIHDIDAGANMTASRCRQNNDVLVESSVGGSGTLTLTNTYAAIGATAANTVGYNGIITTAFFFNKVLSNDGRAALVAFWASM